MISGSSVEMARPMASVLSAMPGPDDEVTPSDPPNEAPMAAQAAAISSSAWKVTTLWSIILDSECNSCDAGVMG